MTTGEMPRVQRIEQHGTNKDWHAQVQRQEQRPGKERKLNPKFGSIPCYE
jgi:hypothetical protein